MEAMEVLIRKLANARRNARVAKENILAGMMMMVLSIAVVVLSMSVWHNGVSAFDGNTNLILTIWIAMGIVFFVFGAFLFISGLLQARDAWITFSGTTTQMGMLMYDYKRHNRKNYRKAV